jgi:hypothetical protein
MNIHTHHIINYSPVIIFNLDIPNNKLKEYIEEIYRLGDSQNQQTNVKAIMSSYDIWTETQTFNPLLDHIGNILYEYLVTTYYTPNTLDHTRMVLKNAWSAIYKKGHYTKSHSHGLMDWSFVYYLKSTGKTPLMFDDSNQKFYLKTNNLIIFPGNTKHNVPTHEDEEDRICLAGNFKFEINKT